MTPTGKGEGTAASLAKVGAKPGEDAARRSRKHGAKAAEPLPAFKDAARASIFAALAADSPVRDPDGALPRHDTAAVENAARTMARVRQMDEWLEANGVVDEFGQPRAMLVSLERATKNLDRQLDALGMTPKARAELGLNLAKTVDLATALSEPDPTRRQELLRQAGVRNA